MKIHIKDRERCIVELTKEDLMQYNITYEKIDYCCLDTKAMLADILLNLKNEFGAFAQNCRRTIIDTLPVSDGGCIFLFTFSCATRKKYYFRQKRCYFIFVPENSDALIGTVKLFSQKELPARDVSIILQDNINTVCAHCNRIDKKHLSAVLSEFGEITFCDKVYIATLHEHAEKVKKLL